ncbi:MAG: molecular chaperone DnaK, partial [Alphaproteobacteria bacterium]
EQQIRIQASGGLGDADIDRMVREAEQFAEEDKKRRAAAEAKNSAESLVHSTEGQLREHSDKIDAGLRTQIETAIGEVRTALEGGDTDAINAKAQALGQVAMQMGQAIYEKEQAQSASSGGGDAGAGDAASGGDAAAEDVVDAEFSEVDDENKG